MELDYQREVLEPLRIDGSIRSYRHHVTYALEVNGRHICNHEVDYEVIGASGRVEIHEVKGLKTAVWILKKKLFAACYPRIPYHVVAKNQSKKNSKFRRWKPAVIQLDENWKEEHKRQKSKWRNRIRRVWKNDKKTTHALTEKDFDSILKTYGRN